MLAHEGPPDPGPNGQRPVYVLYAGHAVFHQLQRLSPYGRGKPIGDMLFQLLEHVLFGVIPLNERLLHQVGVFAQPGEVVHHSDSFFGVIDGRTLKQTEPDQVVENLARLTEAAFRSFLLNALFD